MNNELVINIIKNFKNKNDGLLLSPNTYRNYIKMFHDMSSNKQNIVEYFIENNNNSKKINYIFNEIKNQTWISNRNNINQGRSFNYLIFLQQLLNNIPYFELHEDVKKKFKKHITQISLKNTDIVDDKATYEELKINWKDYKKIVSNITKSNTTSLNEKIIYNLYQFLPIRDNFGEVYFKNTDDKNFNKNFFNITDMKFHLRDYKTVKKYGVKIYEFPDFLNKLIKQQYDTGAKFVISTNKGEMFHNGKLTKFIRNNTKKHFGKSLNINDLRHSIVTYYNDNKSQKKQRQLSNLMGHQLATAKIIYRRDN